MTTRIGSKFQHMIEAKRLYLLHPDGLADSELAERFGVDRSSIVRLRQELGAIRVTHGYYTIEPTPDDIKLARAILRRVRK